MAYCQRCVNVLERYSQAEVTVNGVTLCREHYQQLVRAAEVPAPQVFAGGTVKARRGKRGGAR